MQRTEPLCGNTRIANKLMKFVQDMGVSAVDELYNDSINVFIQLWWKGEERGGGRLIPTFTN